MSPFPKNDARRVLSVLGAIASLPSATLVKIAAQTGLDKRTVTYAVEVAGRQFDVVIAKDGPVYRIEEWGELLRPEGCVALLQQVESAVL